MERGSLVWSCPCEGQVLDCCETGGVGAALIWQGLACQGPL